MSGPNFLHAAVQAIVLFTLADRAGAQLLDPLSCANGNCGVYSFSTPVAIATSSGVGLTVLGGNVGFGSLNPNSPLSVNGLIESEAGGFKFPDGTVQTTAVTAGFTPWTSTTAGISYMGGKVGIGIPQPQYPLDVGNVNDSGQYIRVSGQYSTGFYLNNVSTGLNYGLWSTSLASNGFSGFGLFDGSTYRIKIIEAGAYEMLLNPDGGNVGINKEAPAYPLDVAGEINSSTALRVSGVSVCTSSGCTAASDARLKRNVEPLTNEAFEKILSLKPVRFDWKEKAKFGSAKEIGFIAQEVEEQFPELVKTDERSGMKSVSYDKLAAPLVVAVQELQAELLKQRRLLEKLHAENANLKSDIEKMQR